MDSLEFEAIGTSWHIKSDGDSFGNEARRAVPNHVAEFDRRFSRFKLDSEANRFRKAAAGTYPISREFCALLKTADRLRNFTGGVFDPAVGGILERAGYDHNYRMRPASDVSLFVLPRWRLSLKGCAITIDGPIIFDIGGFGKGTCIDEVASLLARLEYRHILVDGGGDMYGTTKANGNSWRVALEYPGRPGLASGIIDLKNSGVAVSDNARRKWGAWHHIVDPRKKAAVENVIGGAAVAPSAEAADCMTSALFLSEPARLEEISQHYSARYLLYRADGLVRRSRDWQGELFT